MSDDHKHYPWKRPRRLSPEDVALEYLGKDDPEGFQLLFIDSFIGCGVFTKKSFAIGSFLLQYKGELINGDEGEGRFRHANDSFLFFCKHGGKTVCIDATASSGLGRMVNHSRKAFNCRMKRVLSNGQPHLCLFATKDIGKNQQLLYDYGVPDTELPWVKNPNLAMYKKPDGVPIFCQNPMPQVCLDDMNHFSKIPPAGEPAKLKCQFSGSNELGIGERLPSDIIVIIMDKHGNDIGKFEEEAVEKLTISGDDLIEKDVVKAVNDVSGFTISCIKFVKTTKLGCRELCVRWQNLSAYVQVEIMPGTPRKLAIPAWDPYQLPTLLAGSQIPHCLVVQLCDEVGNYCAVPDVRLELLTKPSVELTPAIGTVTTDQTGQADFGKLFISAERGVHVLQPKAYTENCTILGPEIMVEIVDDRILLPPSPEEIANVSAEGDCISDSSPQQSAECKDVNNNTKNDECAVLLGKTKMEDIEQRSPDKENGDSSEIDDNDFVPDSWSTSSEISYDFDTPSWKTPIKRSMGTHNSSPNCLNELLNEENSKSTCDATPQNRIENSCAAIGRSRFNKFRATNCTLPESGDSSEEDDDEFVPDSPSLTSGSSSDSDEPTQEIQVKPSSSTHCIAQVKVSVQQSCNINKRVWDKKHYCLYCSKAVAKLPRHLEQVHEDEIEVSVALAFPKKSKERKEKLDELRNKGNFAHNTEVLRKGEGTIVPYRRPNVETKSTSYVPCSDCLAFFLKQDLWKHAKTCSKRKHRKDEQTKPFQHRQASATLLPVCSTATSRFKNNILDTMSQDRITLVARQDQLIIQLGTRLYDKNGHEQHQHQYIKQKIRELARLLLAIRDLDPSIQTLEDAMDPTKFSVVVTGVKRVAGYNESTGKYEIPSLALKLGNSLKKCALYTKSSALQSSDDRKKQKAESFLSLCEVDWSTQISSQALATLHEKTYNRPKRIPLAQDIKKLNTYLTEQASQLSKEMETSPDANSWKQLAEVTLAQVTLFNRRRGGEMQRLKVEDYERGVSNRSEAQEEIFSSLSPLEMELMKSMARIEMRGKKGRKVAVLVTEKHKRYIDILIKKRNESGICQGNPFLFARQGSSRTPIRSSDVLRKYAIECEAEQPHLLTSTSLRKHIAVITQLLNLKNNELDIVAKFMGHDINIHREYYRLPDDTIELAKVSKLLISLESGNLQQWKGKSLNSIQVSANELISDEENDEKSDGENVDQIEKGNEDMSEEEVSSEPSIALRKKAKKTAAPRRPWSASEKQAVEEHLGSFIRRRKTPGKAACSIAARDPRLSNRSWAHIKFFVKNRNHTLYK